MELNTIDTCDHALDELDVMKGVYTASFEFNHKMAMLHTEQMEIARTQINMIRNQMNEIDLRKKELLNTKATESKLNKENYSKSHGASAVVEDYALQSMVSTNVEALRMLND